MAKILAFIPTRERNTVHIPANILAPFVEKVVVMSKGADTTGLPDNSMVIEQSWTGLHGVREVGDVMAYDEGFDYILQADDDIRFPPELVANLIQLMEDNPGLGACCSLSSVQYYWNREVQSNKHFLVAPFPSQLTLMRAKLVPELQQKFGTVYGGLGTMEDVAKGVICGAWGILPCTSEQMKSLSTPCSSPTQEEQRDGWPANLGAELDDARVR